MTGIASKRFFWILGKFKLLKCTSQMYSSEKRETFPGVFVFVSITKNFALAIVFLFFFVFPFSSVLLDVILLDHVKNQNIISKLKQCLWPANLAGVWLTLRDSDPYSCITLSLRHVARLRDDLKTLYLHYHNDYGHQTCQGDKILRGAATLKLTWLLAEVVLWGHMTN